MPLPKHLSISHAKNLFIFHNIIIFSDLSIYFFEINTKKLKKNEHSNYSIGKNIPA